MYPMLPELLQFSNQSFDQKIRIKNLIGSKMIFKNSPRKIAIQIIQLRRDRIGPSPSIVLYRGNLVWFETFITDLLLLMAGNRTSARVNFGTRTSAQISKNFINFGTRNPCALCRS